MSIIDAGRCAPTAQNRQALGYSVALGGGNIEKLRSLSIPVLLEQVDIMENAVGHSSALKTFLGIPSGHISPVSFMLGYPAIRYRRLPARRPAVINWL